MRGKLWHILILFLLSGNVPSHLTALSAIAHVILAVSDELAGPQEDKNTLPSSAVANDPAKEASAPFALSAPVWQILMLHEPEWYATPAAQQIAENVLLYQRRWGGWPKNIDYRKKITSRLRKQLLEYVDQPAATIDNGATFSELYFLARMYQALPDQRWANAFLRGLDYLLAAQYDNGGWPQYFPLLPGYYTHITFNDNAMIGVLRLLRDIDVGKPEFVFIDSLRRAKVKQAVAKGIDCILKTQIRVNGRLTAWCAQHDEKSLQPTGARAYEHPSLSGEETVGIVLFLMEIEPPSAEIIQAVQSAIAWLEQVKIEGIRVIEKPDPASPTGYDKKVICDANAPPMWARFYSIDSFRPFFSDRNGIIYYDLSQISKERRNEYGWLGYWPQELLNRWYPLWQQKWVPAEDARRQTPR